MRRKYNDLLAKRAGMLTEAESLLKEGKREDYKAIKHMNREDMTKYLYRVYRRGFDAGVESTKGKVTKRSIVPPEPVQTEE